MPRKIPQYPHLTDERIRELFTDIKPGYQVNEAWLQFQRLKLQGAIELVEEGGPWQRVKERLDLWREELPYLWMPARPVLAWSAALVLGVLIGRYALGGAATPGAAFAGADELSGGRADIAELIRSGQIKAIDVGLGDDPENPVELSLTMGREMQLTGSPEREDILAALEYVLVKDTNPGQRLQSARILGGITQLEARGPTLLAMASALLTDENPGVRLSIIRSLQGIRAPLVKDALIKVVLEDENEGVRLAAVESLAEFLDDLSARSALLLVSRMDPMESVRYQAYQVLSLASDREEEERLEARP